MPAELARVWIEFPRLAGRGHDDLLRAIGEQRPAAHHAGLLDGNGSFIKAAGMAESRNG